MTIPTGTRLESREVLVDAETGRELTQKEIAARWIVDYHTREARWPTMHEIIDGANVGMGTASRAMRAVLRQ